jgi:hypothetical protein
LTDKEQVEQAISNSRQFLSHLISYELIRRALTKTDTNQIFHRVGGDTTAMGAERVHKEKQEEKEKFEYFN